MNHSTKDQAHSWSKIAADYEAEFVDPFLPDVANPFPEALAKHADKRKTVADFGCGTGPLLPELTKQFGQVIAIDFAEGMLSRARARCGNLSNISYVQRSLTDLGPFAGRVDVAVAVNSLVLPDVAELEKALASIHVTLHPGGVFLGIVPSIDSVHYFTMLLQDRARKAGMPDEQARQNAAQHAEHPLFDFAFGEFHYRGLHQHFWQPFELPYRLERAGFKDVRIGKVPLSWTQFACAEDLRGFPSPWDWFFEARG